MNFRKRNFRRFPKIGEHLLKILHVAKVELLRLFQSFQPFCQSVKFKQSLGPICFNAR